MEEEAVIVEGGRQRLITMCQLSEEHAISEIKRHIHITVHTHNYIRLILNTYEQQLSAPTFLK